ncbi:Protein of uncharacterised function (DUF826) [Escherichia coli]|uniref:Protein of uncharacterized function (DUF826) n=1 Tax=Escherichia coli TaxID=562 RepID=A0A2X1MWS7_ECOLX|nr:Protein of uncharacterised function (DUF826) [Escherichia coli]STM19445.1 Protein of uncharacterised function (DUF826) [Escherichia coli]
MSEIKSLVTAEAVKEVLRSEEVRSALKLNRPGNPGD